MGLETWSGPSDRARAWLVLEKIFGQYVLKVVLGAQTGTRLRLGYD